MIFGDQYFFFFPSPGGWVGNKWILGGSHGFKGEQRKESVVINRVLGGLQKIDCQLTANEGGDRKDITEPLGEGL